MQFQPLAKHGAHFPRQAQHGVERAARASVPCGFEHLFHVVVDERNLRCHAHAHRNAGLHQRADGAQAAVRCGGARLQDARELGVQRGDGHVHGGEALRSHGCKQVDVALHAAALGDNGQGVVRVAQHLQHAAHEPQLAFDRLIRICDGADGQQIGHVARAGEFAPHHLGHVALGNELRFEIEAGREVEVAVRGPRVAVHAAVLAAPVRVQTEVEADVGRVVVGDGALAVFPGDLGGGGRCLVLRLSHLIESAPAIVERFARIALEPVGLLVRNAPAFDGLNRNVDAFHEGVTVHKNSVECAIQEAP